MSTNCNKYRFLVQQQFDIDLSPQDERVLLGHLEQCESCAKFQHQLQQVIMAAEEVPLPDDMVPANPEALARTIMSQLPEQKTSFFSKMLAPIMNLFSGIGGVKEEKDSGIGFPHISRGGKQSQSEQFDSGGSAAIKPRDNKQKDVDHTGTANRLRSLSAKQLDGENRDQQASSRSLSEKMGFSAPGGQNTEEQPLTLAESIRRRVQQSNTDEVEAAQVQAELKPDEAWAAQNQAPGRPPANMAAPPNVPMPSKGPAPSVPNGKDGPQVLGAWNTAAPMDAPAWSEAAPEPAPDSSRNAAGQVNQPAPAAKGSSTWNEPPRGAQSADQDADWGPPPQGGRWDEPAAANAGWGGGAAQPAPAAVQSQSGNQPWPGATAEPAAAPAWPGTPAQTPTQPQIQSQPGGEWPATQQDPAQPQASPAWPGSPAPAANAPSWPGAATAPAQPQVSSAWGATGNEAGVLPTPDPNAAWAGQPNVPPQPAANFAPQPQTNWAQGAPPQPPQPQQPPQPPAPGAADPWADAWNSPGQTNWSPGGDQSQWSQPAGEPGSWGTPPAPTQWQEGQAVGWTAPAAPGTPPENWTPLPTQPEGNAWGQTNAGWTAPAAPAAPAEPGNGWGQPPAQGNNGWGTPPDQSNWGVPAGQEGWGQAPNAAGMWAQGQAPVQPTEKREPKPSWSADAEQVETGTWRAFTPGIETLGGPAARGPGATPPMMPPPIPGKSFVPSTDNPSRWDVPIQERMKMEQQAAAEAAGQAAAAAEQQAAMAAAPPAPALAQIQPGGWPGTPAMPGGPAQMPAPAQPNPFDLAQMQQRQQQVGQGPGQQQGQPPAGLFQSFDDKAIDKLFSENLGVSDEAAPPNAAPPTAQSAWGEQGASWNEGVPQGMPQGNMPPQTVPGSAPMIQPVSSSPTAPRFPGMPPQGMPGTPPQGMQQQFESAGDQSPAPRISPVQSKTSERGPVASPQGFSIAPPNPPGQQAQSASQKPPGLFNLDDTAMDKLFSENLGVSEAALPVAAGRTVGQEPPSQNAVPPSGNPFANIQPSTPQFPIQAMGEPMAPTPAMPIQAMGEPMQMPQSAAGQMPPWPVAPAPAPPGPAGNAPGGGLFSIDDSVIDRIFADNTAPKDASMPNINVNEAVRSLSQAAHVAPTPPPKIEGVGRLDTRTEVVESGSGRIASIGKFLLDQKDLEKIGKLTVSDVNETKMRILTMEAAQELQTLLQHIGAQEQVVGSVIVGHDGLLIANTMPSDIDAESLGVWALGVYMNTEHVIKKMGQERVHQIVSKTPKGYLVIADFGGGLLVTVSDGKDTDTLIPLMRSITQLVAQ